MYSLVDWKFYAKTETGRTMRTLPYSEMRLQLVIQYIESAPRHTFNNIPSHTMWLLGSSVNCAETVGREKDRESKMILLLFALTLNCAHYVVNFFVG